MELDSHVNNQSIPKVTIVQALQFTTANNPKLLPHDKTLVMMFIQELKNNENMSTDIRQQINKLELAQGSPTSVNKSIHSN
jgi:hypothetical protein